jgi:hypothetical protein
MATLTRISYTDVQAFTNCRVRWMLSSPIRGGWRPRRPVPALRFGDAIHKVLKTRYALDGVIPEVDMAIYAFNVLMFVDGWPEDLRDKGKSLLELGESMIRYYWDWSREHDDFEVIGSEVPFSVQFPEIGVEFVGIVDAMIKKYGSLWIMEHKTCARVPEEALLRMSLQKNVYLLMTGAKGVMYNFLIKEKLNEPVVLKRGGLSKDKSQITSYDVYLAKLQELGLDVAEYMDILGILKERPALVQRVELGVNELALARAKNTLELVLDEMMAISAPIYPTESWQTCAYCAYKYPCEVWRSQGESGITSHLMINDYVHVGMDKDIPEEGEDL